MTTVSAIQVKNVPTDLHEAVRSRATREGKTVGEYVLEVLRRDLQLPGQREWLARVASREPVEGVDGAEAVAEARAERDEELGHADRR
jgi:plasmid stability protein